MACARALMLYSPANKKDEIAQKLEKSCVEQKDPFLRTLDCSTAGVYYFKKGMSEKAVSLFASACSFDRYSCLYLIGTLKADRKNEIEAYHNFCKQSDWYLMGDAQQMREKQCSGGDVIPQELRVYSQKRLATEMEEYR